MPRARKHAKTTDEPFLKDDEHWKEIEEELVRRDALYRLKNGLSMEGLTDPDGIAIDPTGTIQYADVKLKDSAEYLKVLVEISKSPPRQSVAGMYCENCHERSVISKKTQIKAGDEGDNEEFLCLDCGARFVR